MVEIIKLSGRLAKVEVAPPPIEHVERVTLKQAAYMSGYTVSGVRRWVRVGKVRSNKIGGHVLIDSASLPGARKNA